MSGELDKRWFSRNPRKAFALFLVAVFIALDLLAGAFFIPKDHNFRRKHHVYHHGLMPNKEGLSKWRGDDPYPVYVNSLGFLDERVREVPLKKGPKRRVLFIGDSFTEGIGLPYKKTFAGVSASLVEAQGVEILNAAVSSYCPKLIYLKTRHLIEDVGLEIDELYVFLDISDIQDEILYQHYQPSGVDPTRSFTARLDAALKRVSFVYYSTTHILGRREREERLKKYPADMFPPWLNYYWLDDINPEVFTIPDFILLRDRWTFSDFYRNEWMMRGVALAEKHMDMLVDLAESRGIRVTVAVYPWPIQMEAGELESPQVRLWRGFAARRGVGFVDLFPLFMGEGKDYGDVYKRYFMEGDVHWNEAGHRLVAERVAVDILRAR